MKTHPSQPNAPKPVAAEVTRLKLLSNQRPTELAMASHSPRQSPNRGFTRTDLGVVLAVVGLLAVLATSVLGKISAAAHRAVCANNLRQLGVATLKFASENKNFPPWLYEARFGGSAGRSQVYQHFSILSNYVDSPRIMICPGDEAKQPAVDFSTNTNGLMGMGNLAAGYVIMTELSMDSSVSLLMGDRLIGGGDTTITTCRGSGYYSAPTTLPAMPVRKYRVSGAGLLPYWLPKLHDNAIGNLLFADGSVAPTDSQGLVKAYGDNPVDGNRSGCTMIP